MTPTFLSTRLAPLASAIMIAGCATSPPPSVPPPRLDLPTQATRPCRLERLPSQPTVAQLETAYMARGVALLDCEAARALLWDAIQAERRLVDRWRREVQEVH